MPGEYAFEIDSTVGRYWLANGAGFDVVVERGRRVGVVEDVVVDPFTQEVSAVVVRRALSAGMHRPKQVEIDELTAVLPASRRFLITADAAAHRQGRTADRLQASVAAGRATCARTGRRPVAWRALRRRASATCLPPSSRTASPAVNGSGGRRMNACARADAGPTPAQVEPGSYSSTVGPPGEPPELLEPPIEPTPGRDSPLSECTSQPP